MTFRVRALSPSGDYTFGQGGANFLVDSPAAVAQCIGTRLKLWEGEWYLDASDGTPWLQQILQNKNPGLASAVIYDRIMGTPFMIGIDNYSFSFNDVTRSLTVSGVANTAFGPVSFSQTIPLSPGPQVPAWNQSPFT